MQQLSRSLSRFETQDIKTQPQFDLLFLEPLTTRRKKNCRFQEQSYRSLIGGGGECLSSSCDSPLLHQTSHGQQVYRFQLATETSLLSTGRILSSISSSMSWRKKSPWKIGTVQNRYHQDFLNLQVGYRFAASILLTSCCYEAAIAINRKPPAILC